MVAVAIGGAAIVGGVASYASGKKAAGAQKNAAASQERIAADQVAESRRQYDVTRTDFAPYRETGYRALDSLASLYGVNRNGIKTNPTAALEATPGYQFRMDESLKAAQRSAAARGTLASGGTMKALTRYASGIASDEYNNYSNRLAALAGVGQSATGSTAAAGESAVANAGNARQMASNAAANAGNARASAYANTGSAINSTVNNLASMYLYSKGGGFGAGA